MERLGKQYQELHYMTERLKAARDFESLKEESKYYVNLSGAEKELGKVNKKKATLEETIRTLQEGQYKELQQKEQSLKQQMRELQASIGENQGQMSEKIRRHENLSGANDQRRLQPRYCAPPETVTFLLIRPASLTVQKSLMKPMRSFWKNIRRTTSRRMKRNLRNSVILSIRVCGRM